MSCIRFFYNLTLLCLLSTEFVYGLKIVNSNGHTSQIDRLSAVERYVLQGERSKPIMFTGIPQHIRRKLKSVELYFVDFEFEHLIDSLKDCPELKFINLIDVRWKNENVQKIQLTHLVTYQIKHRWDTSSNFGIYSKDFEPNMNLIFFYKNNTNWTEDFINWKDMTIEIKNHCSDSFIMDSHKSKISVYKTSIESSTTVNQMISELGLKEVSIHNSKLDLTDVDLNLQGTKKLFIDGLILSNGTINTFLETSTQLEVLDIKNIFPDWLDVSAQTFAQLKVLRITNMNVQNCAWIQSQFTILETLELRNCNLYSSHWPVMENLKRLVVVDVFNSNGSTIVPTFENIANLGSIYLGNFHGETLAMDLGILPRRKLFHAQITGIDLFISKYDSRYFPQLKTLILDKVNICQEIANNFDSIFRYLEYINLEQNGPTEPNLILKLLRMPILKILSFQFDWNPELKSKSFDNIQEFLKKLDINENPISPVINLRRHEEGKSEWMSYQTKSPKGANKWNSTTTTYILSQIFVWGYPITLFTIISMGLLGNCLSAVVLSRKSMRNSSTSVILLGLTLSDMILLISSIPHIAYFTIDLQGGFLEEFNNRDLNPQLPMTLTYYVYPITKTAYSGSVYCTILVTLERYIAVCLPLQARSLLSSKKAVRLVLSVYLFSICLNLLRWVESYDLWDYSQYEGDDSTTWRWNYYYRPQLVHFDSYVRIYHDWIWGIFMYLIPFLTLFVINLKIWYQIRKASQTRQALSKQQPQELLSMTRMLVCIVLIFIVCNSVHNALTTYLVWFRTYEYAQVEGITCIPLIINSSVNFIVYCSMGSRFRKELMQVILHVFPKCKFRARNLQNIPLSHRTTVGEVES